MQVKATNVLAKELKKFAKQDNRTKDYTISFEKVGEKFFTLNVDMDYWANDIDFDYITNTFKVIKIVYPYDYYASNKYLTTRTLQNIFKNSDKTYNGFFNAVLDYIEI